MNEIEAIMRFLESQDLDDNLREGRNQLRRILEQKQFEIVWSLAPHWANYHAYDEDGVGYWYEKKPYNNYGIWKNGGKCIESGYTIANWQETLTSRPDAAQNK